MSKRSRGNGLDTAPKWRHPVLDFDGIAEIDGTEHALQLGHTVDIPLKATHRVSCTGDKPLVFIEIQYGQLLDESDIIRLSDDYNRV
ncbi:hypothetical protein [Rhizobium miluonense]|uniref:Mannose-6-phosphate isomerase-like protein (Cupin superfamily) n=1 Tax=Rhizobium miluonense TaxID=411945 RepID=A0ABU1SR50_9HYPH|nr:hypothetical protein [Rhizobium miluonense]MDR6901455.1 mannose-6-phosphate isomerase-like protein (cupin superfamily) [Rhizobium miluonense]